MPLQWDIRLQGDDGVTGMGRNMTGDAVAEENEYIRVSMISVDEHRTVQSDFKHDSLGIRDCALPECVTQPMLAAYEDLTVCVRESLPSVTTSCFGLCGLTNQFHHADFEWCVECVKRLLWGFIVSCVVSIVGRGIDVFITGCDVLVSIDCGVTSVNSVTYIPVVCPLLFTQVPVE